MARLIGPSEASREVKTIVSTTGSTRDLFKAKKFRPATFYVDPDPTAPPTTGMLTTPADIRNLDGTMIADSTVTTDAYSMLPLVQFPDGADSLIIQVDNGPPWRIYAREDDRIDALTAAVAALLARIEALEGGGGGGTPTPGFATTGSPSVVAADDTADGIDFASGILTVDDVLAAGVSYAAGVLTVTTA